MKFVITDRRDFDFARYEVAGRFGSFRGTFLLSPAYGRLKAEVLAKWMLEEKVDCKLNLQLHKLIFENSHRGV